MSRQRSHLPHAPASFSGGYFVILVLVFGAVFIALVSSLAGFIFIEQRAQLAKENRERALQIAEAGLDYYRWFLAHFPDDTMDGTGGPGPYVHTYADPEGGVVGSFSLDISGNEQCGTLSSVDIISTGMTDADPTLTRTVSGRYTRPSVAEYAYIINSNVWAGADREIVGPYHSNGGIRMDGTNNSLVTSGVENWTCTNSFGCDPTQTVDGVFGGGSGSALWEFPVPIVDFVGITADLVQIKDRARDFGLYLEPTAQGKRLVFLPDGTVDVYIVNATQSVWGYSSADGWVQDAHIIQNDTHIGNMTIPADCRLIFAESDVWIEGVVRDKITLASANLINPNTDTSVILNGDITYTSSDGSSGLTVVAEEDILVPLLSPEDMVLNGIFIAQNGQFGRHYYTTSGGRQVPSAYDSYVQQNSLSITGTIVSNERVGTKWVTGGGVFVSGYDNRINSYDQILANDPPPFTPYVSSEYEFIEWRDE